MRTLLVLRHAKSDWDNFDLPDFDRPLNERGSQAAPLIGQIMAENQLIPDVVVSSPAKRAAQTAHLVCISAQSKARTIFDARIYEADLQSLLQVVSGQRDENKVIMIVGHNPGFEALVRNLTGKFQTMKTANLAVIDLNIEKWDEICANCGTLRVLIKPKADNEVE